MSALAGMLVGGLITWLTARYYYREATKDLKDEADRFARIVDETFTSFEQSGWCRVRRDGDGRPIAIIPRLTLGGGRKGDQSLSDSSASE